MHLRMEKHDAAYRVIARLKKERDEARMLLAQAERQLTLSASSTNTNDVVSNGKRATEDEVGPDGKRIHSGINLVMVSELTEYNVLLSGQQKNDRISLQWGMDINDVLFDRSSVQILCTLTGHSKKVEKLIKELLSTPADLARTDVFHLEKINGASLQHLENGTDLRETQSILLERIAGEMNRLKFYISHAK